MPTAETLSGFEISSQTILGEVQSAFRAVLAESRCDGAQTAAELQKSLGLDKKLGWQVFRVIQAPSPMTAGFAVPSHVSTRRLVAAAQKRGATSQTGQHLADTVARFERFVRENTENRAEFESIIADWAPEGRESIELANRRDCFHAMSRLRGIACQTTFYTYISHPSDDGDTIDRVMLHGYWGVRRLGSSVRLLGEHIHSPDASSDTTERTLDGEPITDPQGILLADFCSQPVPTFETSVSAPGEMVFWMQSDDIGLRSAAEVAFAARRNAAGGRYRTDERPSSNYFVTPVSPTQRIIFDCVMHKDLITGDPRVFVHETAASGPVASHAEFARRKPDMLDWRPPVRSLGQGVARLRMRFVPRYVDMLNLACEKSGWDPASFLCYRVEVEYPVPSWQISLAFEKPVRPA